ncbi:gametogenetin-binding protein 2 [Lingula anatina]|uniref:Gametogenetin-binding protein 2 n=1 Tax=Lingula anatina TaxID=7574 RepID=A0A1S3ITF7_LINAN|nr:gametogenetin-binding protein 2 [Lingula anatina]|eukprot:XP_013401216.1 gametogenetin-binding protein 2 [Lingula anatina]
MAKLVAVCRTDDYQFGRRQIPLIVDESLSLVLQFTDTCIGCEMSTIKMTELERFVQRFHALSQDEIATALMVTGKEVFNLLSQMVPCVGCRRSVEKLFGQLVETGYPALEPLIVAATSCLSISRNYLFDPKAIYALFYIHGSKLTSMMESIPKSKKNKRCQLHSLDTHKSKPTAWMDTWDLLSQECREEVVLIDTESLMDTLDVYLRKHRFCSECKSKVLRAYSILVGDSTSEKGFCPALYEGLRCCPQERHLHVLCETDFIAHLIGRAEPELAGSRRERHAKTLDIAQEEVLTCLGIHLYERLHRISQKLKAEEQTWQILFYLGVDALKKNFEVALERKQGITNLELMCQELLEEEQAKEIKKEHKRQKKKKKKTNKGISNKENCQCDENSNRENCTICECSSNTKLHMTTTNKSEEPPCSCGDQNCMTGEKKQQRTCTKYLASGDYQFEPPPLSPRSVPVLCGCDDKCTRSDYGYSSDHEVCDSCSTPSSREGSDVVVCGSGELEHDGEGCHCPNSASCARHFDCGDTDCNMRGTWKCTNDGLGTFNSDQQQPSGLTLSLQDMLDQASCSSEGEDEAISEEEIQRFKANQKLLEIQRQQLRERLRQEFTHMQERGRGSGICTDVGKASSSASPPASLNNLSIN